GGRGWSDDFEQFDFEVERGAPRNRGRVPHVAVGDVRRAYQHRFAAHFHTLHAFRPAFADAVERELGGFVPLVGTVELGAVGQRAAVVNFARIGGFRRFAGARCQFAVD